MGAGILGHFSTTDIGFVLSVTLHVLSMASGRRFNDMLSNITSLIPQMYGARLDWSESEYDVLTRALVATEFFQQAGVYCFLHSNSNVDYLTSWDNKQRYHCYRRVLLNVKTCSRYETLWRRMVPPNTLT